VTVTARRLDGTAVAAEIRAELAPRVAAFAEASGRPPTLAIVLAGENPASELYVRNKQRAGTDGGLAVTVRRLPADTTRAALLDLIGELNDAATCDGILVQSPLATRISKAEAQQVFDAIDPAKDVDGFHPYNAGLLAQGRAVLAPCTPSGIIELLTRQGIAMAGRHAVVIGRSEIVGKPMALLLLQRDATVTVCHSKTADLPGIASEGDILVAAIGRPGFVTPDFVKPGATVIDVGITSVQDRAKAVAVLGADSPRVTVLEKKGAVVIGDVHPSVEQVAGALTPVPGGVGPLTIAMLLKNTLTAAERRLDLSRRR
jgi:methylenetetrahydrofolate dehydrogenase (NADP+)/methenyltetrahydrofolate cyclohydrolase